MSEQEPSQMPDKSELFPDINKYLPPPPEWINFEHPDFPKYFYIAILDENGEIKTWWQRIPQHLCSKFP
ncbi:MAG: hypothetical protein V7K21_13380 [Nostoc sp.]|uniref:hypothetical protein n=1 Tax=Nostoc sp. TaxID=1180 RepID=UPI002FFBCF07